MKLFTACIGTETHTFAPLPTDMAAFEDSYLIRNGEHPEQIHMFGVPLVIWRDHARARGWDVAESLCTFAVPSGITLKKTYEALRDEVIEDLKKAMPVDGVILSLHGAMVADGHDDCEGDLVRHIREILGPDVPLGVEFDLHCHIGRTFVEDVDALVIFKEYPHTDFAPRAEELWTIMEATLDGKMKPQLSIFDSRMIGVYHTTREPMISFVKRMKSFEGKDGILSVSLGHGFPWADVKEQGSRLVVITDNDIAKGDALAESLGRELWNLRDEITPRFSDIDTAIDEALATEGCPVTLSDMADNPGGGAVGDSTFIMRRLIERGITDFAVGSIWDPVATAICMGAGEGVELNLRIGGKISPDSGDPLDVKATIKKVVPDCIVEGLGGSKRKLGDAVCLDVDGAEIIIHSLRCQNMHTDTFVQLGIDISKKKILVVKSMQHFYGSYAPVSAAVIYVAAPGTLSWDFSVMPYTKVARPVWPIDTDPWASNEERPW